MTDAEGGEYKFQAIRQKGTDSRDTVINGNGETGYVSGQFFQSSVIPAIEPSSADGFLKI